MLKNLVFVHGSYYNKNFGDYLLLKRVAKELGYQNVRLPFSSKKVLDEFDGLIKNISFRDFFLAKACIFGGGGYLGEPSYGVTKWSINFIWRHFIPFLIMKALGVEVYIVGAGFGPISKAWLKPFVRFMLRRSKVIMLRDIESVTLARNLSNADEINIQLVTDLAQDKSFLLDESTNISNTENTKKPYIALHVGTKITEHQKLEIKNISQKLIKAGYSFIFFADSPGHNEAINNESDVLFSIFNDNFKKVTYTESSEVIALIKNSNGLITGKLHTGIIASTFGIPTLSIPTHQKTIRYYKDIESVESCLFNLSEKNESKLINLFFDKVVSSEKRFLPESVLARHSNAMTAIREIGLS